MSSPANTQIVILRPRMPVLVRSIITLNAPAQFSVCETLPKVGRMLRTGV